MGQPNVEMTEIADGDKMAFTAEVDIRPTSNCRTGLSHGSRWRRLPRRTSGRLRNWTSCAPASVLQAGRAAGRQGRRAADRHRYRGTARRSRTSAPRRCPTRSAQDGVLPGLDDAVVGARPREIRDLRASPRSGDHEGKPLDRHSQRDMLFASGTCPRPTMNSR